eukprot:g21905.t1
MLARERLIDTARRVYRSYGFGPIDTPALEYSEILLGKGGGETEKQMFRFRDQGDRDIAMRFDLTIPFARYAAANLQQIGTPFKRYHIGTVWRAEKPQKGRFREFMQCDFDTIGTKSNTADIETLLVIHDLFEAIGREFAIDDFGFTIRVNNRMVLSGLLESLGVADRSAGVLRMLDKLPKIGRDKVVAGMVDDVGLESSAAESILDVTGQGDDETDPESRLDALRAQIGDSEIGCEGVRRLIELFQVCRGAGVPDARIALDLSIARGLDYYTGTIYETFLESLPGIGSVCSGGRYDNLAGLYTSQVLPGVGASLGLDRLLAALEELGNVPESATPADVLFVIFEPESLGRVFAASRVLREAGVAVEVFPDALDAGKSPGKHLGKQLKYANRKGFRIAVIAGADELANDSWQVKDLASGDQSTVASDRLTTAITELLASPARHVLSQDGVLQLNPTGIEMADSNQDRRATYRFPVRERAETGTLKAESERIDVELVNVSSGGFGVRTGTELPIEVGKEFRLEANTGKHDVVVTHTRDRDEGRELGLRRLRDLHDEELPNRRAGSCRARFFKSLRSGDNALLGGKLKDFDLRLSFRCNATNNSGIQYRSKRITGSKTRNKWVVRGYQHEIRNQNKLPSVSGFIYDEGGLAGRRGRMCLVGEKAVWSAEGKKKVTAKLITADEFAKLFKLNDWNEVVIIARGNRIQHYLNDRLILDCTDNHPKALKEGVLALQLHGGKPMWAEFKNIRMADLK